MKPLLILGIGNMILGDEGIGIHVIERLQKQNNYPEGVDIVDGATGGYFLLNDVVEYEHVILVDATLDSHTPGSIRVLRPKYSTDYPPLLSAHEFGLKDMIDAMIFLEKMPDMHLIVISVAEVQQISLDLSPAVEAVIPQVIERVNMIVEKIMCEYYEPEPVLSTGAMG